MSISQISQAFEKSKEEKRPKENGTPETVVNKEKEFIA